MPPAFRVKELQECFRPVFERNARELVDWFALGRHFCVGALLARTEVEVAVDQLLDAMPDLRFDEGADTSEEGLFTRGPASVPVRFTPAES